MKNQVLFSSKSKSKKLKCYLLQFSFGPLRVNFFLVPLQDYYEKSYGNDISGPLACTMLQHMFDSMDEAISAYKAGNTQT